MVTRRCLALVLTALTACSPQLTETSSIVMAPRVIAVQTTPPEALPGSRVHLKALLAGADGSAPQWAFCHTRKPLAELEPISRNCVDGVPGANQDLGEHLELDATVPPDGCQLFGPDVPTAKPGEPAARPVDADSTGGYFQPVRVALANAVSFGGVRLSCGLTGVTSEQLTEFNRRFMPNRNPTIAAVVINGVEATRGTVRAGDQVTLDVRWVECPSEEVACDGAETYASFAISSRSVVSRREAMAAAFYASSGRFSVERVGTANDNFATSAQSVWIAPTTAGEVSLWFVLRDDRGGVGTASATITVE